MRFRSVQVANTPPHEPEGAQHAYADERLGHQNPERAAVRTADTSFDGLAALNDVREQINDLFEWDFVHMSMVHTAYSAWARRNLPAETPLAKRAFTRRLREALPECSSW